jgi:hypothetical protein
MGAQQRRDGEKSAPRQPQLTQVQVRVNGAQWGGIRTRIPGPHGAPLSQVVQDVRVWPVSVKHIWQEEMERIQFHHSSLFLYTCT